MLVPMMRMFAISVVALAATNDGDHVFRLLSYWVVVLASLLIMSGLWIATAGAVVVLAYVALRGRLVPLKMRVAVLLAVIAALIAMGCAGGPDIVADHGQSHDSGSGPRKG